MPDEFEAMTWSNYQRVVIGHYKREAREWERVRVIYSILYNVNSKTSMKAEHLIPIWSDKLIPKKVITKEDRDRILESIRRNEECQKS